MMGTEIFLLDETNTATGWTVLNDATENLAVATSGKRGYFSSVALEFDKKDGSGFTEAGADRTIDREPNRDQVYGPWLPNDKICWSVYIPTITNVKYSFVRIGASATNCNEYRTASDPGSTALQFTTVRIILGDIYPVGSGADLQDLNYLAIGVEFDAEANVRADIAFSGVWLEKSVLTGT